jgi:hypothetical protein
MRFSPASTGRARRRCRRSSLDRMQPGKYQPRTRMDDAALDELAASIREHGVMQPILVRPIDGGRFEIVAASAAGARRSARALPRCRHSSKRFPDQSALALAPDREHPARGLESARASQRHSPADRRVRPHP